MTVPVVLLITASNYCCWSEKGKEKRMLSIPAPAGVVAWPQSKLSSCLCIAIVPTAGLLLCEPLPYTASRVKALLCKVVIPKPGSMYVAWKQDTSYQLLLWRQRLPALLGCMQKQSSPKQQVTDCIAGSLWEQTTMFVMTWWCEGRKKDTSNGKLTLGWIGAGALCSFRDRIMRPFQLSAFWSSVWFWYLGTMR